MNDVDKFQQELDALERFCWVNGRPVAGLEANELTMAELGDIANNRLLLAVKLVSYLRANEVKRAWKMPEEITDPKGVKRLTSLVNEAKDTPIAEGAKGGPYRQEAPVPPVEGFRASPQIEASLALSDLVSKKLKEGPNPKAIGAKYLDDKGTITEMYTVLASVSSWDITHNSGNEPFLNVHVADRDGPVRYHGEHAKAINAKLVERLSAEVVEEK